MDQPGLLRSSAPITAWNLLSRLTGFVRVLAVGAALGATFLGNTYQSANLVSNLLFELLAAGVLSAVLVPTFVGLLSKGDRAGASRVAGAVAGALLVIITPVVAIGVLGSRPLMHLLTLTVSDPDVRAAQIQLGTFLLWFFLPQMLLYTMGTVATGLVQADHRFAAAAGAPVANNLVVAASMAGYWAMRDGAVPTLSLPLSHKLVLAVGTTAGVAAMTLVPLWAGRRAGLAIRPRWAPGDPDLRRMARQGLWAGGFLGLTQVLLGLTLVLANRVEGGAVAFQIAFTFFLLPYALIGNPLMTALFPRLAADAHAGDRDLMGSRLGEGLRLLLFLVLPASAILVAVARPLLDVLAIGALRSGSELVAQTVAAYAVGLAGYSAFQMLTRASYSDGDTRTPTLVNLIAVSLGSLGMLLAWSVASGGGRVVVLGLAHSAAQVFAAILMGVLLARRLPGKLGLLSTLVRSGAGAALAGAAAWWSGHLIVGHGRGPAAVSLVLSCLVGAAVYAGSQIGAWPGRARP